MCSIFGALVNNQVDPETNAETNRILAHMYGRAFDRGRDGRGFEVWNRNGLVQTQRSTQRLRDNAMWETPQVPRSYGCAVVLGNTRAEPTTEFVKDKADYDQQPYNMRDWTIVHNGTIANDKDLRIAAQLDLGERCTTNVDSAAIAEVLAANTKSVMENSKDDSDAWDIFYDTIKQLKGSYAILAKTEHHDEIYVACNYRPIWYITSPFGFFFASTRESFPRDYSPKMVEPYSAMYFGFYNGEPVMHMKPLMEVSPMQKRALVVCSGGLDSVVSAVVAQKELGYEVELIHFLYGSRAEGPEVLAVQAVAADMGVPCRLFKLPVYDVEDSPLLDKDSKIAGGEAGAEFAHEWVPARNLLLLSVATAVAEAKGFDFLVLGNNLEEAGAYPDNEPEFIAKFNDLLPFAVGDGKRVRVLMPVGNMMKHEIVALGHKLGAPMHHTWSCYRAGAQHCGTCGPCYMRRTAFKINNLEEVISYEA